MIEDDGATAEVEESNSGAESLNDSIGKAYDEIMARESAPAESGDNPDSGPARSEDGKFAKKDRPAVGNPVDNPDLDVGEPTDPVIDVAADPAPNTWRKEVAAKWATLPDDVRAEVQRREADFHKGIAQYKEKAEFGSAIERAVAPYAETLRQLGIGHDRAVAELMAADDRLRNGPPHEKHQYFAQLAQNYRIDLSKVAQVAEQVGYRPLDPNIVTLQDELRRVRSLVESRTIAEQKREQETLNSEILKFKSDPSHSHFDAVKGHMAALLQAGQADGLADAYEQAVYANPVTRQSMLQQQAEKTRKENAAKAEAAKKAARANVRSRPSLPTSMPTGTIQQTVAAAYDRLTTA